MSAVLPNPFILAFEREFTMRNKVAAILRYRSGALIMARCSSLKTGGAQHSQPPPPGTEPLPVMEQT
jgi:hypothetical protein